MRNIQKSGLLLTLTALCAIALGFGASSGCSQTSELTRGKAKEVIEKSEWLVSDLFSASPEAVGLGIQRGLWEGEFDKFGSGSSLNLKGKAKDVFSFIHINGEHDPILVNLNKKVKESVVEITGITGVTNDLKIVEFTTQVNLGEIPNGLGTLFKPKPSKKTARLRLFDDGWRVFGEIESNR